MCVDGRERGLSNSKFGDDGGVSACLAPGKKAVVVQVTDSCPCVYPSNAASNAKWCWCAHARACMHAQLCACVLRAPLTALSVSAHPLSGDVPHFDLSWAVRARRTRAHIHMHMQRQRALRVGA